jgi:hypothetical protein
MCVYPFFLYIRSKLIVGIQHVKEKVTASARAEEARLGQIALDEVIEKSGKLLGVQKGGMIRARLGGEGGSDEEEDEDEYDEESDEEGEQEEGGYEDELTMGLLGDVTLEDLAPFIKEIDDQDEDQEDDVEGHADDDGMDVDGDIDGGISHLPDDDEEDEEGNQFGSRAMSLASSGTHGLDEDGPDEEAEEE